MTPHPRPGGRRGYQCDAQKGGCGALRRTAVPIEDHVRDEVLMALATPATRATIEHGLEDSKHVATAQALISQREDGKARLRQLRDDLADGRIDADDFAHAKARILARIEQAEADLATMTDTRSALLASLPDTFEALREAWDGWALDERRAVLKLAIVRVRLKGKLAPGTRFRPEHVDPDWRV
jgi:hypothetical protein